MSVPGTPSLSRPVTRPGSPSPGAVLRSSISKSSNHRARSDPLKAFPTHLSQRIFGFLDISDLANCARVCKKWCSSQSINYGKLYFFRLEVSSLILGQYGFGGIARRILMTKAFPLGNGLDGNRSRTGYGPSRFSFDALTLFTENLIHPINSDSRVGWFWVYDL